MTDPFLALQQSRIQAFNLSDRIGRARLATLLEQSERSLAARLHADPYLVGKGTQSFTAAQMRATLNQIRIVTAHLTHGVERLVGTQAATATDKSVGSILEYLGSAEKAFKGVASTPLNLNEARMLDRVSEGVNSSLLRRLASSGELEEGASPEEHVAKPGILQRYGLETVSSFEDVLQQGMIQKKPWGEVREELTESSTFLQGKPAYWAERIVRTETMGAYNRAGWETIRNADETLGDMVKILSATFDDRTGWDSYQLHGQIRLPDQAFQWGEEFFQHPPNRPNDREVVVPHRISWPIPPYLKWKTEAEVFKRWVLDGRKGKPPPRPPMTTVPLEKFGHES